MIYLDTHMAAWLYADGDARVSPVARAALQESDDVRISPLVRLELQYLFQIGRVTASTASSSPTRRSTRRRW